MDEIENMHRINQTLYLNSYGADFQTITYRIAIEFVIGSLIKCGLILHVVVRRGAAVFKLFFRRRSIAVDLAGFPLSPFCTFAAVEGHCKARYLNSLQ